MKTEEAPVPEFVTYSKEQMAEKAFYTEKDWASLGYGIMPNQLSVGQSEKGELLYGLAQIYKKAKSKL